jgi:hypothetical protein
MDARPCRNPAKGIIAPGYLLGTERRGKMAPGHGTKVGVLEYENAVQEFMWPPTCVKSYRFSESFFHCYLMPLCSRKGRVAACALGKRASQLEEPA